MVGVSSQLTKTNLIQPNLLGWVVLKGWWVGLGYEIFSMVGRLGLDHKIHIYLTRLDPLIFNIYLKFKKYSIQFCYLLFFPFFLNKIQTVSSSYIVWVGLVLFSWLFDYKFALIYIGVVLMLNLLIIIIIIIKKMSNPWPTQPNPIHVGWVGLLR